MRRTRYQRSMKVDWFLVLKDNSQGRLRGWKRREKECWMTRLRVSAEGKMKSKMTINNTKTS